MSQSRPRPFSSHATSQALYNHVSLQNASETNSFSDSADSFNGTNFTNTTEEETLLLENLGPIPSGHQNLAPIRQPKRSASASAASRHLQHVQASRSQQQIASKFPKNNEMVTLTFPCTKQLFTTYYIIQKIPNHQQFQRNDEQEYFIPRKYENFSFILEFLTRGTSVELALNVLHAQLQSLPVQQIQELCLDSKFLQLTKLYTMLTIYLRRILDPNLKRYYHCALDVSQNGLVVTRDNVRHGLLQDERWLAATLAHAYTKGTHHLEILCRGTQVMVGVTNEPLALTPLDDERQRSRVCCCFYSAQDGTFSNGESEGVEYAEACRYGDRLGIYLDMDQKKVQFYKNDLSLGWISLPSELPSFCFTFLLRAGSLEILPFAKKPTLEDEEHFTKSFLLHDRNEDKSNRDSVS